MTAELDACKAFRRAIGCAAIGLALCCADNVYAAPTLSFEPSLSAGARLGEPTTLTAKLTFAGTEYFGHPEPLTGVTLRLPAGSILSNEGFPTCSIMTLEQQGPNGCPTGSVAGLAGSFTGIVSFGTETVVEPGTTETFFTEGGGLLLYFVGHSPVSIEVLSRGVLEPASAPFGPAVRFEVPLIETVPGGHDASFTALTLGLGAFRGATGEETGSVTVPEGCPKGELGWRADTTFNDETGLHEMTAHTEAETACPAAGTKGSGEKAKRKAEEEAAAKKHAEEEAAANKKVEEEAAAKKKAEEEAATKKKAEEEAKTRPVSGVRAKSTTVSGTVLVREGPRFVALSGTAAVPLGTEVDATAGRVLITVATPQGGTQSAEVYGGRFRIHQDSSGEAHFILTLPLTGCPRGPLPHGSAASIAKHSGAKARHLWVSETGGSWGTNGRYVATTVQGTTWLTLDECTRSEVKVTAGKVKVLDLTRKKTKTVAAGHTYVAATQRRRHA